MVNNESYKISNYELWLEVKKSRKEKGRQKILKSMGELVTYNGEFIAQIVE